MKVFNKIICFILIFVLFTPVIVSAAEPIVTPADSGISSTYDENYVYIIYDSKTYSCDRHKKINTYNGRIGCELFYDSNDNEAGKYFYLLKDTTYEIQSYELSGKHTSYNRLPVSLEKTYWNNDINVSYWYSPGSNRCYVFSGGYVYGEGVKGAGIISYSASSSNGNSYLKMDNGGYYSSWVTNYYGVVVCSIFDFNDGSFKSSMVDLSASSVRTPSVFYFVDENKIANASTVTGGALRVRNYNYIDNTYLSSDVEYEEKLPDDLVCVYSNHLISGFWQPDGTSNIVTPSYYFNYQYIFKADKYILFVDSADKLKSITKSDSNALFTFSTTCNKRIYYSLDGKSWTSLVDIQDMYSLTNTISSSYCFDTNGNSILQLLFTSDDEYGKPLYEWKSLPDTLDKVSNFDVWYDPTTGYEDVDLERLYKLWTYENNLDAAERFLPRMFSPLFFSAFADLLDQTNFDYAAKLDDYVTSSISKSFYYSFLMPGTVKFLQFDESTLTLKQVTQSSVYSMIQAILESSVNNTEYLKATREELFDYFTNLNNNLAYIDSSITSNFKDLKKVISPMASALFSVKTLLEHNNVNVLDIHKLLANTLPSLAFDDSSVIAAIKDISITTGGSTFNFDDSAILSRLDSIRAAMSATTKPTLRDYDDDPDDDNTSVVDFVSTGLSDLVGGTVIQPIVLAPGVLSAVTFVNTWIGNIWDNLGKLRPVVVLGLTFTVVNVVIRREEATA
uniref:hypothetical protein n=1 Tax=Eshraghiella crossota TaxID=45851 RepID=UPI0040267C62